MRMPDLEVREHTLGTLGSPQRQYAMRLHRRVAVGLRDLLVAAGKQFHRLGLGRRFA